MHSVALGQKGGDDGGDRHGLPIYRAEGPKIVDVCWRPTPLGLETNIWALRYTEGEAKYFFGRSVGDRGGLA